MLGSSSTAHTITGIPAAVGLVGERAGRERPVAGRGDGCVLRLAVQRGEGREALRRRRADDVAAERVDVESIEPRRRAGPGRPTYPRSRRR